MRAGYVLSIAAGAVLFLGTAGPARADRYDSNCANRISQLERNVAKYESHGRWNDARKERAKLAQTRANCGYGGGFWGGRGRDDRWRDRDHDRGRHNGWYWNNGRWNRDNRWRGDRYDFDDRWRDHYRDNRWRDRHGRNLDWFRRNGYFWHDNHWCRR